MSIQALANFFDVPFKDWYPEDIPEPEQGIFDLDAKQKTCQRILTEAILHTYPILRDDKDLRDNIDQFEELRGNYPLRREPRGYSIRLHNDNRNYRIVLERLGFKIV
jgi:erythronate-4-phosphate dehydrogenase